MEVCDDHVQGHDLERRELLSSQGHASEDDLAVYAAKLTLLSDVIQKHAPDVLALQEVGGEEPIADLQAALMGAYPNAAVSIFPDGRGIRVAFLSKLTFDDEVTSPTSRRAPCSRWAPPAPETRMGRGALRIRVSKDGNAFDVMTAHLKSKLLSFPRPWGTSFSPTDEQERAEVAGLALMRRAAEAVTVRIRANELIEGDDQRRLIVLGDMNDGPQAQTSLILTGPPGSEIGTGASTGPTRAMTRACSIWRLCFQTGISSHVFITASESCWTRSSPRTLCCRSRRTTIGAGPS